MANSLSAMLYGNVGTMMLQSVTCGFYLDAATDLTLGKTLVLIDHDVPDMLLAMTRVVVRCNMQGLSGAPNITDAGALSFGFNSPPDALVSNLPVPFAPNAIQMVTPQATLQGAYGSSFKLRVVAEPSVKPLIGGLMVYLEALLFPG